VKGILGGDDFQSLDALDNDGKQSQPQKNKRTNADGAGYAFENLGSTPVQKTKKFEEEKEKEKPKGPLNFSARAKVTKTLVATKTLRPLVKTLCTTSESNTNLISPTRNLKKRMRMVCRSPKPEKTREELITIKLVSMRISQPKVALLTLRTLTMAFRL